jgi:c-di-GMP-binding flagellar brake protein YcgR
MENIDKRREPRYPIEAEVIVHRNGEDLTAHAVNISASGMLLTLEPPSSLRLDEEVSVDVELPDDPSKPLSSWGIGKVIREDRGSFAIQIFAGMFNPDI